MNWKKPLIVVLTLVALCGALTACGPTREEALQTPLSVFELTNATFTEDSTFGYVNQSSEIIPLTDCGRPSFWEQRYCQTSDGVYVFKYSTSKYGSLTSATLTVDGITKDMTCSSDPDGGFSATEICIISE